MFSSKLKCNDFLEMQLSIFLQKKTRLLTKASMELKMLQHEGMKISVSPANILFSYQNYLMLHRL